MDAPRVSYSKFAEMIMFAALYYVCNEYIQILVFHNNFRSGDCLSFVLNGIVYYFLSRNLRMNRDLAGQQSTSHFAPLQKRYKLLTIGSIPNRFKEKHPNFY